MQAGGTVATTVRLAASRRLLALDGRSWSDRSDSSGANHPGTLVGFTSAAPDHGILSGTSGWSSEGRLDFDGGSDEVQTAFPLAELVDSSFTLEGCHS